jgi:hypothetical protein
MGHLPAIPLQIPLPPIVKRLEPSSARHLPPMHHID